jgi:flagellar biogenesis protein FliO
VRFDSLYATISTLIFVLGLFFLCVWLVKRGSRKHLNRLPAEVVSVLGRVSLAPKQMAELLRVGNKLVLVAFAPDGPRTLTEVTDAAEVDRLVGLCSQRDRHSSSRAFEQVFRELAHDGAPLGFLGNEAPVITTPPEISVHRSSRGGSGRG